MRMADAFRWDRRNADSGMWRRAADAGAPTAALSSGEEAKQRLRVNRFLLASGFSIVYLLVLLPFHLQGKVDRATLLEASALVAILIATFFSAFRLGFNLRFADPSLTAWQLLAAVVTMLFVVYRAPETRVVFATFFFVAIMFGMLRLSARTLGIFGVASLAAFTALLLGRYAEGRDMQALQADLLQLCVIGAALPWFLFIGSRVKRLKEADRRKDEFLATLAHELRNPLAPIRMGIHILRLSGADAPARPVLPMMERQLQHLTRLLDDLLDVSRITRDKIALRIERVDLRKVVQLAIETSSPLIDEMHHALGVDLPDEPLWVDADLVRLAQVFGNLLGNAAKYTPEGGRIAVRAQRRGDDVEVFVRDNGYGIPPERLESIFDMFTQLDSPLAKHGTGLGIGLSLAKRLVALHHGSIEAKSAGTGRGSEFRVTLPAAPVRADDVPSESTEPASPAKCRTLVVDDNRDAASSLAMFLELAGHEVRVAYDGERALHLAEQFQPYIVFLDLGMPGIDGYEVCRRLRATPWGRATRLIAVTGWGQDEDQRQSALAGFDLHLVKPVDPETLAALLRDSRNVTA
ncbi:MAG TPA: ATP-binding protein [Casimicrobiaceae bacterium]|nr:ATP-binding protein [Casimicrobiaceae bacterium]